MLVEYPAVARKVAQEIGMDMFDDTTYQPHRLMYWPSTSSNGEFIFRVLDGDVVNPDYYLGLYDNWRDVSTWPVSSRESEAVKKTASQQADPLTKDGVVGAFSIRQKIGGKQSLKCVGKNPRLAQAKSRNDKNITNFAHL